MARKTPDEVQAEIDALKALLPSGGPYRAGIEVSLRVLEKRMSHDAVFDAYEGGDLFDDAHAAANWRDGHSSDEAMSAQFKDMME